MLIITLELFYISVTSTLHLPFILAAKYYIIIIETRTMSHRYNSKSSRIYIPFLLLVAIVCFGNTFHEEFRPCKKVAIDDEVAMNITTKILKVIPWTKIRDGFPFVFKHPKTDMTAIVCLPEKIASTTWKSLFIKVLLRSSS